MQKTTISYRPDIDGLRAISIAFVVAFHLFPKWLPGGFVGVDVFFVISGFLITTILLKEFKITNTFSILDFYKRRFIRILPSLITMLLIVWILGRFFLLGDDFQRLGKHLFSGALFFSNMQLWSESGYFDIQSHYKPLLHLWSLAIEEQFYLVWPILLLLILKIRSRFVVLSFLGVFTLSFCASLYHLKTNPASAFYLLSSRFWELLIGGILAYCTVYPQTFKFPKLPKTLLSLLGIAPLILLFLSLFSRENNFPGFMALLPTIAAAFFIAQGPNQYLNRFFSHALFQYIGKISYPLYLWHWPLIAFANIRYEMIVPLKIKLFILVISFILADLTRRFIEMPTQLWFKKSSEQSPLRPITVAVVGLGIPAIVGWQTYAGHLYTKDQKKYLSLTSYANYDVKITWGCLLGPRANYKNFSPQCISAIKKNSLFIWGDSHSSQLAGGIENFFTEAQIPLNISGLGASSCPPVVGIEVPDRPHCKAINDFILGQIKKNKPRYVILSANWVSMFSYAPEIPISETIQLLQSYGVQKVLVLGQFPLWEKQLYRILVDNLQMDSKIPKRTMNGIMKDIFKVDPILKANANKAGAEFIELLPEFCNEGGCLTYIEFEGITELQSYDNSHLTIVASKYIMNKSLAPFIQSHVKD